MCSQPRYAHGGHRPSTEHDLHIRCLWLLRALRLPGSGSSVLIAAVRAYTPREGDLHVVLLDKDAGSCFIVRSSLLATMTAEIVYIMRSGEWTRNRTAANDPS